MKVEALVRRCTASLTAFVLVFGSARAALAADDETGKSDETGGGSKKDADEGGAAKTGDSDEGEKSEKSDKDAGENGKAPGGKADAFGHGGQFGARVGVVGGYRMILRYDDSPPCRKIDPAKGKNQPKFCGHVAPFGLTPALSYGIADWLEPFAWGRFGLEEETETYTEPVIMFGAGVRVYTMSDAPFKIFIEPSVGIEIEDSTEGVDFDDDFVIHLAAGPSLDLSRNVGVYLTGGITTTILRSLSNSLDIELGIQGRY